MTAIPDPRPLLLAYLDADDARARDVRALASDGGTQEAAPKRQYAAAERLRLNAALRDIIDLHPKNADSGIVSHPICGACLADDPCPTVTALATALTPEWRDELPATCPILSCSCGGTIDHE